MLAKELPARPPTKHASRSWFWFQCRNDRTVINLRQKALAVCSVSITWDQEALSELRVWDQSVWSSLVFGRSMTISDGPNERKRVFSRVSIILLVFVDVACMMVRRSTGFYRTPLYVGCMQEICHWYDKKKEIWHWQAARSWSRFERVETGQW
jgi:hypothetical protein